MESLSRHRLRRRDPASNGGVSSKTPYEDVGFSNWNGGKGKAFKARDYAEIFSGSSSIPVFDISSFDERVGSGEYRSSNLDYGDVFGGLRNYDVAVAYEELLDHFNGSVKESNPRVSSDRSLSSRDSGPRHPMMNGKKRVSGEVPDQDTEEFYMPSSGSSQQNVSVSDARPRFSPKYEVSRAWSFSAQVEFTDNKSQLNCSKSNGSNEVNCRSQSPKVSNNSSPNIFKSSGKVFEQTKASSLASEEDVTGISFGETSQPFFVEGFDENSPAAASAAALKKAVDDARERITLAKFMMERRKKGGRNSSKRQQKVLDESKPVNKDEGSDPVFTPSGNYIDLVINAGEGKATKNGGVERHMKNVETIEVRTKTIQFTGSKANGECMTVNPLHRNIDDDHRFIPSGTVLASFSEKSENGNENLVSVEKEPEVFVEKHPRLSKKRIVEEKMVEEANQRFGDANRVHDSGDVSEIGSIRTSRKDQEQENGYDKAVENLQNSLENQVINQGTIHSDDMGRIKENFCSFVVNEVPEQEGIGDGVHSISECTEKVVHKQASSQEDLEMTQNNLEKKINHDHSILRETEVSRTKMYCKKQEDGGDENQPELSRTCDQSDEEIKLDAFEHRGAESLVIDAGNCSDDRKRFNVQDVATTSCDIDRAGRDEDHSVSVPQETGCEVFSDESIHDIGTDSDLHQKEYAEAVRSSTGSDATTSEVDGSYSTFYKEMEHEQLDLKGDQVFRVESVHQTASENHPESKICDGFEGISECEGNEQSTVIPDASRDSAADVPKVPPVDSKTRETEPEIVLNSQEQTSECCNSSVATPVQEHADGLSGFESEGSKQDLSSKQEEYKGEFVMVDELSSAEGHSYVSSSQLNSKFDAMQANKAERHVEDAKDKNFVGEKDAKEGAPFFVANDQQQRIEAIRKGREREKDRLAVERAIREARERAKEKLERVAAEKQQAEKAATEAKLRAERAAVERATAEARERAFEKVKSLKTFRSVAADKVSISLKNDGLKHSFSSSDLEVAATCTESAQRRKARLERHQRVVERVAKALEEKNKRDLLVQKEQAERNRMAEHLDADIKRWSAGKEGNLRALLSTLHYILGAESGWKTISLTEIITTADVKKAYRKATLCVHPDKVQQRGASVQQKYICEKVFDLLKAAWNKFNSEER